MDHRTQADLRRPIPLGRGWQGRLDTVFDLSNDAPAFPEDPGAFGDFSSAGPIFCPAAGCPGAEVVVDGDGTRQRAPFLTAGSTANQTFVARFRGYLNVTPDKVAQPIHYGIFANNAASLTIFNNAQAPAEAIIVPSSTERETWRSTRGIRFSEPGLYPVEILYIQQTGPAALELSARSGAFTDFEGALVETPPIGSNQGFALLTPSTFFQTTDGSVTTCTQCPRMYAGKGGTAGCEQDLGRGYTCNDAAICERCASEDFCGELCLECRGSTPYCDMRPGKVFHECVECTEDSQCPNGRCDPITKTCKGCNDNADCPGTGRCDLATALCVGCNDDTDCPDRQVCDVPSSNCVQCTRDEHCGPNQVCSPASNTCVECNQNSDCERGKACSNNACVTCSSNDSCAGNSCNCCPEGTRCAAPSPGAPPSCVECTTDSQCAEGKTCDPVDGRCVDKIPECNTSERCGASCVKCPSDRPFCFDGQVCVACRNDLECGEGQFCLSGECSACTSDRHCGLNCEACGKPDPANPNAPLKPFCLTNGSPATSACVGCRDNADCPGGTCDTNTNTCINTTGCEANCAEQGKVCNGSACVQCFADAHCPCGGSCDVATGSCTSSCDDGGDCLGTQFCSTVTQQCEDGRRKPGTTPNGGSFCCEATAADLTSTGTGAFMALLLAGFLLLYSRRSL